MIKKIALALMAMALLSSQCRAGTYHVVSQYKIATTGSASTAKDISEFPTITSLGREPQAVLWADGCSIVYKFGGSAVAASPTATSSKLSAGNFLVPSGAVLMNLEDDEYISAVSADGASSCTLWVSIGYGEN